MSLAPLPTQTHVAASQFGGREFSVEQLARRLRVSRATMYRQLRRPAWRRQLEAMGLERPRPQRARGKVLAAVRAVIAERGFTGLTIEAVAREAGVAAVTIFRQFESRDGLIKALVRSEAPPPASWARLLPLDAPLEPTLATFAEHISNELASRGWLLRAALTGGPSELLHLASLRDPSKGTRAALTRYFEALRQRGRLRRELDPALAAESFASVLLVRALVPSVFRNTAESAHAEHARQVAQLFARGLKTGGRR